MYISYIITHRICSRHKFNLTWSLKPIPLDLCSDACSTELASLTKEWCQGTQTCAWMLGTELVWASPNVTLYVLSTSTLVQLSLTFNFLGSSVASLSFFFRLIINCQAVQYCYGINLMSITVLWCFASRYKVNLTCYLYLEEVQKVKWYVSWEQVYL